MKKYFNILLMSTKEPFRNHQTKLFILMTSGVIFILKLAFFSHIVIEAFTKSGISLFSQNTFKIVNFLTICIFSFFLICYIVISLVKITDNRKQIKLFKLLGYTNIQTSFYFSTSWGTIILPSILIDDCIIFLTGFCFFKNFEFLLIEEKYLILYQTLLHSNILLLVCTILLCILQYKFIQRIGK